MLYYIIKLEKNRFITKLYKRMIDAEKHIRSKYAYGMNVYRNAEIYEIDTNMFKKRISIAKHNIEMKTIKKITNSNYNQAQTEIRTTTFYYDGIDNNLIENNILENI